MKISLIVSTYNRPDALSAELDSLFAQRRMPDEIIIGDDGSRDQTRRAIEAWAAKSPPRRFYVISGMKTRGFVWG